MINIYCDGSSKGNPGIGGFGIAVIENNIYVDIYSKPIKNKELVLQLYNFAKKEFPNFYVTKISGHNGIIGNEIADAAATFNQAKLEKIFLENKDTIVKGKVFENF